MIRRAAAACLIALPLALTPTAAHATKAPPCQVTGTLSPSADGGHVTAVFHVAETCKEVSLLSWLAPDAHAGMPQTLYDRHAKSDVPPGDYRWTITRPADGCFFQLDLHTPGHNVDAITGGDRKCQPPSTTTTTSTPSSTSTTTAISASTTVIASATTSSTASSATPTTVASPSPSDQLPHSGNGEVGLLTVMALGLIGAGRYVEYRGRKRRERVR